MLCPPVWDSIKSPLIIDTFYIRLKCRLLTEVKIAHPGDGFSRNKKQTSNKSIKLKYSSEQAHMKQTK